MTSPEYWVLFALTILLCGVVGRMIRLHERREARRWRHSMTHTESRL